MKIIFSPVAFEDQHNGLFYPIASGLTELPDAVAERAIVLHADKGVCYADLTQIEQARHLGLLPPADGPQEEGAQGEVVEEED